MSDVISNKSMVDNSLISVPVSGNCVTRNGVCEVGSMTAEVSLDGLVKLGFVSSKLHRSLNAWAHLKASDIDDFCKTWESLRKNKYSLDDTCGIDKSINLVGVEKHLVKALLEYISKAHK